MAMKELDQLEGELDGVLQTPKENEILLSEDVFMSMDKYLNKKTLVLEYKRQI